MARKKTTEVQLSDQAAGLAEYAAKALIAAEQLGIKNKVVDCLPLSDNERKIVASLSLLPVTLKRKLAKTDNRITFAETASLVMTLADALLEGDPLKRLSALFIAKKLIDCLEHNISVLAMPKKASKTKATNNLYQFKISLLGAKPSIWRRIQVRNCSLDRFHEYIQTAMGWTNSHLHHFRIGEQFYGDPELMQEDFDDQGYQDSTSTQLSDILPKSGKRFRFVYEYDFGDSWEHEVLFEGRIPAGPSIPSPVCLEGERSCPPEDVGGVWGYADFVEAIANPEHEQHDELLEWAGGEFNSEAFSPAAATKAMHSGLPDWRKMR
jgi:hypothetical protein